MHVANPVVWGVASSAAVFGLAVSLLIADRMIARRWVRDDSLEPEQRKTQSKREVRKRAADQHG